MKRAVITGVAGHLPDYVLSNKELESMVDTNDQWIRERTGIVERRIQKGEGLATSDMIVPAIHQLLERTGTAPEEVDLLICCTVTADYKFPDTGTISCHKAGLTNAFGYDISAACSGFLFGLHAGAQYIQAGTYKKVIVAGADKMSSILDYTDRTSCILFGDGAGVVMLEPTEEAFGIHEACMFADGSGAAELILEAGGAKNPTSHETIDQGKHYLRQNGRVVFKHAVKGMAGAVAQLLEKSDRTAEDIAWLVPHQANVRIIESVIKQLDFPIERVMLTIEKYGNTTAATIPLCLRDYESQINKGDELILTAFGGGYTWGAIRLIWGY